MNRFQLSLILFLTTVIAGTILGISWVNSILQIIKDVPHLEDESEKVSHVLTAIFTPGLIISTLILIGSSLAFKILAIVHITGAKHIEGLEKVLWVIGLIFLGFITGILYLVFSYQKRFDE